MASILSLLLARYAGDRHSKDHLSFGAVLRVTTFLNFVIKKKKKKIKDQNELEFDHSIQQ